MRNSFDLLWPRNSASKMASKLLKIGFIGGGKMAQAMAKGFIAAGKYA